jgi:hypothetical protein
MRMSTSVPVDMQDVLEGVNEDPSDSSSDNESLSERPPEEVCGV